MWKEMLILSNITPNIRMGEVNSIFSHLLKINVQCVLFTNSLFNTLVTSSYLPVKIILDKAQHPIDKIAQIVQQLRVIFSNKVGPIEGTVLRLRADVEQVETEDIGRNVGVFGVVSEHPHTTTLRELAIFII